MQYQKPFEACNICAKHKIVAYLKISYPDDQELMSSGLNVVGHVKGFVNVSFASVDSPGKQ